MAVFSAEKEREATRLRGLISSELLAEFVIDYKIFETIAPGDTESLALRNYGLSLLYKMGLIQDDNIKPLIDKWLSLAYTAKE
jgi:hypothetical protein